MLTTSDQLLDEANKAKTHYKNALSIAKEDKKELEEKLLKLSTQPTHTQVRFYEKQTLEAKNQLKIMENRFNELQKENVELKNKLSGLNQHNLSWDSQVRQESDANQPPNHQQDPSPYIQPGISRGQQNPHLYRRDNNRRTNPTQRSTHPFYNNYHQIPNPPPRKPYRNPNKVCYYHLQGRCIYGDLCYNSHPPIEKPLPNRDVPPRDTAFPQPRVTGQVPSLIQRPNPIENPPLQERASQIATYTAIPRESEKLPGASLPLQYSAALASNLQQPQSNANIPSHNARRQSTSRQSSQPSTYQPLKITGYSQNFIISPEYIDTTKKPMMCKFYLTKSCRNENCDYIHELIPKH